MSMRPIQFCLNLFGRFPGNEARSEADRHRSEKVLLILLEALTNANQIWLKTHPDTPSIYKGVDKGKPIMRYRREVDNEVWADIPTILKCGYADCEDLGCARTAELRKIASDSRKAHGDACNCDDCTLQVTPWISWRKMSSGGFLYHCRTWRSNITNHLPPMDQTPNSRPVITQLRDGQGFIEDPSLVLGMSWIPEAPASIQEMFNGEIPETVHPSLSDLASARSAQTLAAGSRPRINLNDTATRGRLVAAMLAQGARHQYRTDPQRVYWPGRRRGGR